MKKSLSAKGLRRFVLTDHVLQAARRRGLEAKTVRQVVRSPEQREAVRSGRDVLQSRKSFSGKEYLVRVFVDVDRDPPEVVTAYRTSKVEKYWRRG